MRSKVDRIGSRDRAHVPVSHAHVMSEGVKVPKGRVNAIRDEIQTIGRHFRVLDGRSGRGMCGEVTPLAENSMKIFLSSTAQDLVAYRKVADDTILRMSSEAVAMERFGPLPGEPVAECERKAREC